MTSGRTKSSRRLKLGDIFELLSPDGRLGYGQIVVSGTVFYVAIFRELFNTRPALDELLKVEILLVGWTLDALIYHGDWKVVGNRPPISERVPFPNYKVRVNGTPHVRNFQGDNFQPATASDWELLDAKTTVAPIRYQNALFAYHGLGEWRSDYEALTVEHVQRRVPSNGMQLPSSRKH